MDPVDPLTLPRPSERSPAASESRWRDELAPAAQPSLFAAAGSQRGLDGRWYEHPEATAPKGPETEPLLGTNAEFCTRSSAGETELPGAKLWGGHQLVLDLADTAAIPQLDLFTRRDLQHAVMCEQLGDAGFEHRLSKCGRTRVPNRKAGVVTLYRDERGTWHHTGHVKCEHMCCAKCGTGEARSTAATLGVGFTSWLHGRRNDQGGRRDRPERLRYRDVWMLTLTLPHKMADAPGATVEKLFDAHARFKRSAAWRNFCREWGINSAVRVLDPTFGGRDGVHPHFHIALFVEKARDRDERPERLVEEYEPGKFRARDSLLAWRAHRAMSLDERKRRCAEIGTVLWGAWHDALRAAGVEHMIGAHALELSPGEKAAAYFTGWGLADEVGATTAKHRSHLRLLDAAGAGVVGAGEMFVQWVAATHGKQWITGVGDLRARLEIRDEDIEAHVAELRRVRDAAAAERGEPVVLVRALQVDVPDALHAAALSLGWPQVHKVCSDADERGEVAQLALIDALCAERRRLELLRCRARGQPP